MGDVRDGGPRSRDHGECARTGRHWSTMSGDHGERRGQKHNRVGQTRRWLWASQTSEQDDHVTQGLPQQGSGYGHCGERRGWVHTIVQRWVYETGARTSCGWLRGLRRGEVEGEVGDRGSPNEGVATGMSAKRECDGRMEKRRQGLPHRGGDYGHRGEEGCTLASQPIAASHSACLTCRL